MAKQSKVDRRGERRMLAFVESVTFPDKAVPSSRISLVLDSVDRSGYLEGAEDERDNLAIVRVSSTPERLLKLFQLDRIPREGDWIHVGLAPRVGNPLAWVLPAVTDYQGPMVRTHLVDMAFVADEETPGGLAEQADVADRPVTTFALVETFNPPEPPSRGSGDSSFQFHALFAQSRPNEIHLRVMDVGQASCVALHVRRDEMSRIIGFFDVGAPLFFNRGSCPTLPKITVPRKGFVVLSHWDFDHYAMALPKGSSLRALSWFAPNQTVGPNCRAFQKSLGDRLSYLSDDKIEAQKVTLFRGQGGLHGAADDRNATGYVLRLDRDDGAHLLTGDVGYQYIPTDALDDVVGLTVPHHGGKGSSAPPPAPANGGRAIASYGVPNKYKHPDEVFLTDHDSSGWSVWSTAKRGAIGRASRWL